MHTHQSLFKGDKNAFFDIKDEFHLSKLAKSYMAGILKHSKEITPSPPSGSTLTKGLSGI